ncbi:hypothetical protein [Corynebacterium hiratae]|uniref:hypothetical protein n=1 Tax=Corynebacterium hiratae TaxID=3139423 RepID=UPI001E639F69|nr:hypothetical protein [Corynebacterium aurimucosum]
MPNPTRQEIIEAYDALEKLCQRLPATRAAKEPILRALPPKPHPTMAEVEWDGDKHFLAEANHPTWGRSTMLGLDKDGWIEVISWDEDGPAIHSAIPCYLVPTGKRYMLTEVQE